MDGWMENLNGIRLLLLQSRPVVEPPSFLWFKNYSSVLGGKPTWIPFLDCDVGISWIFYGNSASLVLRTNTFLTTAWTKCIWTVFIMFIINDLFWARYSQTYMKLKDQVGIKKANTSWPYSINFIFKSVGLQAQQTQFTLRVVMQSSSCLRRWTLTL